MSDNINSSANSMVGSNVLTNSNISGNSLSEKVYAFANASLRRAASALFRATEQLNNEISIVELLDVLEDVGIRSATAQPSPAKLKNSEDDLPEVERAGPTSTPPVPIATFTTQISTESMSTTASFDAPSAMILPLAKSQNSLESTEVSEEEPDEDDCNATLTSDSAASTTSSLRIITLEEVGEHYTQNDAWMVIYDKVYDFTNFMYQHPGGWEVMQEYAGYDATMAFRGVGHSSMAIKMMEPYLLGILPESERLYKNRCQW